MKCVDCVHSDVLSEGNFKCTKHGIKMPSEIAHEDHKKCLWEKHHEAGEDMVEQKTEDVVNHPSHYTSGKVECIDCIESAMTPEQFCGFLRGNVIKYCFRCGKKDEEVQELKKAEWYLQKLIQFKEGQK